MNWTEGKLATGFDGYADFDLARTAREKSAIVVPVYLSLKSGSPEEVASRLAELIALEGQSFLPDYEKDRLCSVLARGKPEESDLETVVYTSPGTIDRLPGTVLFVGPPVARPEPPATAYRGRALAAPTSIAAGKVVVACIDDSIGYLNERFRATPDTTRFDAVWIMGADQGVGLADPPTGDGVVTGRILREADINSRLASGRSEADIYASDNDSIFPPGAHKPTNLHFGHGTHVLDIAAGGPPGASGALPRLLAVQLPPQSLVSGSGRRLEHYVLQALGWILHEVRRSAAGGSAPEAVIITLSLGTLAGPKSGSGFFESWLRTVMDNARASLPGVAIRLVAAYGNARRLRLAGRAVLDPGSSSTIGWRVLPEDFTASYLELRVPKAGAASLSFSLVPPSGQPALPLSAMPTPGQVITLGSGADMRAAIFATDEGATLCLLFALAPTACDRPAALCEPGLWQIRLANSGTAPVTFTARVQRDDTPQGFRLRGRQSYLEGADAWTWDDETAEWDAPDTNSLIRRDGTDVSFSSAGDPDILFVAAAEPDPSGASPLRPALYSAEGDTAAGTHPTISARADDGRLMAGRIASGVLSGSSARLSGTSVAAPLAVSALVARVLGGSALAAASSASAPDPAEVSTIVAGRLPTTPDRRTGYGWLSEPPARDRRPDLR